MQSSFLLKKSAFFLSQNVLICVIINRMQNSTFNDKLQRGKSVSEYATAVNEGALSGTVLLKLETEDQDLDANADVTYYITEGDHLNQFEVNIVVDVF